MNSYAVLLLEALLFGLCFGALSWLRGEGLPKRLVLEVMVVTATLLGLSLALGRPIHPILFLVIVYLVTMRCRLLVDLANWLTRRGKHETALKVLAVAGRVAGDEASRSLVRLNTGVVWIRQRRFDEAVGQLSDLLATLRRVPCGPNNEAACRYNLAVANLKAGRQREAMDLFQSVVDLRPNSLFARASGAALERETKERSPMGDGLRDG